MNFIEWLNDVVGRPNGLPDGVVSCWHDSMSEVVFEIREDETDGGFIARALGHSIRLIPKEARGWQGPKRAPGNSGPRPFHGRLQRPEDGCSPRLGGNSRNPKLGMRLGNSPVKRSGLDTISRRCRGIDAGQKITPHSGTCRFT